MKKELGIVLIVLGLILVFLVSPMLNNSGYELAVGGPTPEVYWHCPFNNPSAPTQLLANINNNPWIIIYTPDETNYTNGYSEVNNFLGNQPWPVNGTLHISGGGFSATSKLALGTGDKMQVGYLYGFGLGPDWATNVPYIQGDPVPAGSTVVAAWYDPTKLFLCTPGPLYQQLQIGEVYTFSWTVNVPNYAPLTAVGFGKEYYNLQGNWTLNGKPVTSMAVNVSSSTLTFNFMPTLGAANISTVYVQILMRGALTPATVTLSFSGLGGYSGSYNLPQDGVYDIGCYFTDLYGTVYEPTGTVVIYKANTLLSLTPESVAGFGTIGVGLLLIALDRKQKPKRQR